MSASSIPWSAIFCRRFSASAINHATHSCKLLVIGGGSGGCAMASRFARKLPKDSVIVLEPSTVHYYQPLFTLVGAGICSLREARRSEKSLLPSNAMWLKDFAEAVDPEKGSVTTKEGHTINYEYLVVAVGLENNYRKVPGLLEALEDPDSRVSTIYSPKYCEKTDKDLTKFKKGHAVFTFPDTPIKCPGAPQKIAYLADTCFTKRNIRSQAKISYNTCLPVIFGVKKYADALLKVVERKNIDVNYNTVLKEVRRDKKEAVFFSKTGKEDITVNYDLLHVTPPMRTVQFLRENQLLADKAGFLTVDKFTLQHKRYPNVYGIGDCTDTPNSKTAAAVAKQSYVVEQNLLSTMLKDNPKEKYNGYGACPLVTSFSTCIMAEFLYDGVPHETLPFNQAQETMIAYQMKRHLFPFIYWNMLVKGWWSGPEVIRKIINPFACN